MKKQAYEAPRTMVIGVMTGNFMDNISIAKDDNTGAEGGISNAKGGWNDYEETDREDSWGEPDWGASGQWGNAGL